MRAKQGVPPQLRRRVWPWLLRESRSQLEASDCPNQYRRLLELDAVGSGASSDSASDASDSDDSEGGGDGGDAALAAEQQQQHRARGSTGRQRAAAQGDERAERMRFAVREIDRDVDRSGVETAEGRAALRRVLVAAARAAPEVGYCQVRRTVVCCPTVACTSHLPLLCLLALSCHLFARGSISSLPHCCKRSTKITRFGRCLSLSRC